LNHDTFVARCYYNKHDDVISGIAEMMRDNPYLTKQAVMIILLRRGLELTPQTNQSLDLNAIRMVVDAAINTALSGLHITNEEKQETTDKAQQALENMLNG